ncbi:MAG: hypothetical protein U0R51_04295 [Solirubrobacterales bacterium]
MKIRMLVPAVVSVLLAAGLLAGPASADTFNTTVSISKDSPLFHGKVRSRLQSNCEPDRRVILYRKVPGFDVRVARDRSNFTGKWKIKLDSLKDGQAYYVIVRQQRLGNDINCAPATSKVVKVKG